MKKVFYPISVLFLSALLAVSFNGCVDKDFDQPPATFGEIPDDVVVNSTIAQLKDVFDAAGGLVDITDDLIISGVVTTSDETGNFYKEVYIQDETGGLKVSLDINDIFGQYQEGRRLYIKCQGLTIDQFGVYSLGAGVGDNGFLGRISPVIADEHIFAGETNQNIIPATVSINDLFGDVIGTLVTLEDIQFIDGEVGATYADAINQESLNRNLTDCDGNIVIIRNSGFADFATDIIPGGNGTVIGIAGAFGDDIQMLIRSTDDVNMPNNRCDGTTGPGPGGNEVQMDIADVRALFTGTETNAPAETKIVGTVISDRIEGNTVSQNVVIQDATGGITVRFSADHFLNLNDEVEIVISGEELSEFNGLLQVDYIPTNSASVTGTGSVSPVATSIADLLANLEGMESTLVRIEGAALTGASTYSGGLTLNDGTGSIDLWTQFSAGFADALAPTNGENVSIVAIVSEFNGPQLNIRNLNDVSADGGNPPGDCEVDENFSSGTGENNNPLAVTGWSNLPIEGNDPWVYGEFGGDVFAKIQGFNASGPDLETWLITPSFDISTAQVLTFNTIIGYAVSGHDALEVFISENFDGSNVGAATWTPLSANIADAADAGGNNFSDKVPSGEITLPTGSTAHIAFVYTGDNSTNTTTMEVDDVKVCEP
jgi:hypothetical protein